MNFTQLLNLAQIEESKGEYNTAASYYEKLAHIRPSYYGNAAWAYLACANWKKSQEMFKSVGGAPTFLIPLFRCLECHDVVGSQKNIEDLLLQAQKEKDSDFLNELVNLSTILSKKGIEG